MVPTLFRAVFVVVLFGVAICHADPPSNDNFENRILLQGSSVSFTGILAGATLEEYDLAWSPEAVGNATVWWSWIASDSTPVTIYCQQMSGLNNNGVAVWYANHEYTNLLSMRPTPHILAFPIRTAAVTSFGTFVPQPGMRYEIELIGYSRGTFPLRLVATNAPIIFEHPVNQTAPAGSTVLFFVSAGGAGPLKYQWQRNGVNLPGETGPLLELSNITASAIGSYSAVVSNMTGSVGSESATLMLASESFVPSLSVLGGPHAARLDMTISGETGRYYRLESSTNLVDWSAWNFLSSDQFQPAPPLTSVLFTKNGSAALSCTNDTTMRFFRLSSYSPVNEKCNANLKKMRLAKQFWARDSGRATAGTDSPTDTDLVPYMTDGKKPQCPGAGTYYFNWENRLPECSIAGHTLEEPR